MISVEEETKIQIHPCSQKGLLFLRNLLSKCLLKWLRVLFISLLLLSSSSSQDHQVLKFCLVEAQYTLNDDNVPLCNYTTMLEFFLMKLFALNFWLLSSTFKR